MRTSCAPVSTFDVVSGRVKTFSSISSLAPSTLSIGMTCRESGSPCGFPIHHCSRQGPRYSISIIHWRSIALMTILASASKNVPQCARYSIRIAGSPLVGSRINIGSDQIPNSDSVCLSVCLSVCYPCVHYDLVEEEGSLRFPLCPGPGVESY